MQHGGLLKINSESGALKTITELPVIMLIMQHATKGRGNRPFPTHSPQQLLVSLFLGTDHEVWSHEVKFEFSYASKWSLI